MGRFCPLLGPKSSAFCIVMSVCGVIFLGLLGLFFYTQAVTLYPDLHITEEIVSSDDIGQKYSDKATQCWIAAAMYGVTFILVMWQNKYNTQGVF